MAKTAPLIPVHVSEKEIRYMNYLQKLATGHNQLIDPNTDIRSYVGLSEIIKKPEVKKLFKGVLHTVKNGIPLPPALKKTFEQNDSQIKNTKVPPIPSDTESGVRKMAKAGEGDDKHLVMIPEDVVEFLDSIEGTKKKESKFGLQEFSFFDNVFEGVATTLHSENQREHHFMGAAIGLGALALGAFFNHQADQEEHKAHEKERNRKDAMNAAMARRWNKGGLDHMNIMSPKAVSNYTQHGFKKPSGSYKKGGMVLGKALKGPGHGQEDLINMDIPEKTWIWDAHTVSNFGNGSSEAGQKEIERLEKFAAHKLKKDPQLRKTIAMELSPGKLRNVPCAVANDERRTTPIAIAALGEGSNDLGSKVTREMTEMMREHKISNGRKLPRAAPDIIHLYKKAAHKHGMEV